MEGNLPEPVRGSGHGNTLGTNGEREDLSDRDPGGRTPGRGEEEDVDTGEQDKNDLRCARASIGSTSDTNDPLADTHANGTIDQERTTTKALNGPEGQRSRADVDDGSDHRDEEGILDTDGLEESGREVEDKVDTSPLLHHLEKDTNEDLADVGVAVCDATREHADPADLANRHFILKVGLDLSELIDDVGTVGRLAADTAESLGGSVQLLLLDVVARRLRKEEETNGEDDGPGELNGDWDSVGASV